jgi:hypothetical protein
MREKSRDFFLIKKTKSIRFNLIVVFLLRLSHDKFVDLIKSRFERKTFVSVDY